MKTFSWLLVPALVCGAQLADAEPRLELGATLGAHTFSDNGELGVDDDMAVPGPVSSFAIGARGAYVVLPGLAVEGEMIALPTQDSDAVNSGLAFGVRAHVRYDILRSKVRPFVAGGMGAHLMSTSSSTMRRDLDRSFHWGAGVRYAMSNTIDLRVDARHLIVPDRSQDGATSDFELTAGVSYRFGTASRSTRRDALDPIVASGDRDLDTIDDAHDRCPSEPEDIDSFEDDDGCPELDNDRDGVGDTDDTCPSDAETKNDFRDTDGCPDQVIAELTGISFEPDSARIDQASAPLLDRARQLLAEYPKLVVEIAGHTSSEGNADRNMTLSLERAEAVKAALVKRGISASRIMTVGHGSDLPVADNTTDEGRRKNRRIEFRVMTPEELPI